LMNRGVTGTAQVKAIAHPKELEEGTVRVRGTRCGRTCMQKRTSSTKQALSKRKKNKKEGRILKLNSRSHRIFRGRRNWQRKGGE